MAMRYQTTDKIDQEVDWRAMTGVLDLRDVFQLVDDRLDNRSRAMRGHLARSVKVPSASGRAELRSRGSVSLLSMYARAP